MKLPLKHRSIIASVAAALALACASPHVPAGSAPQASPSSDLSASSPTTGRLLVKVLDQTNGPMPGATVWACPQDAGLKGAIAANRVTGIEGTALFASLPSGTYRLSVAMTYFAETGPRTPLLELAAGAESQRTIYLTYQMPVGDTVFTESYPSPTPTPNPCRGPA